MKEKVTGNNWLKKAIIILAVIGAVIIATALIIVIIGLSITREIIYASIIVTHYPVTIGLPIAGIGALVLVFLLEYTRGPIEFAIPGFKFKGAAGPIVLWVLVYLAIASSMALLWNKTMDSNVIVDKMFKERLKTSVLKERYLRCQMEKKIQNYNAEEVKKLCAEELRNMLRAESEEAG